MRKILYIGVHSHVNWGAEYWLSKAFDDLNIKCELLDYRKEFNKLSNKQINTIINSRSKECDLIFLQRGDYLFPQIFNNINIPLVFWSTEPIQLKNDVDQLLNGSIFSWVFVHSYSCLERVRNKFPHLIQITSVMHNAAPKEMIEFNNDKTCFAVFNRNQSLRRRLWLWPSSKMITRISGRYGDDYFNDLKKSQIAINIHFSNKNLDDFESGIFEAMASGCVIISERLFEQTVTDLAMTGAIIQVDSPSELKEKLKLLKSKPKILTEYIENSKVAIRNNTWHERAFEMQKKFQEVCN